MNDIDQHRLYSEQDDLTLRKQAHRNDYMERLVNAGISPSDQTVQADRWWPGTVPSKWEEEIGPGTGKW